MNSVISLSHILSSTVWFVCVSFFAVFKLLPNYCSDWNYSKCKFSKCYHTVNSTLLISSDILYNRDLLYWLHTFILGPMMHSPQWSLFILYWLWCYHYFILMNWQYILAFDPYKWWLLKSGVKPGGELWHGLSFQVRTHGHSVENLNNFSVSSFFFCEHWRGDSLVV